MLWKYQNLLKFRLIWAACAALLYVKQTFNPSSENTEYGFSVDMAVTMELNLLAIMPNCRKRTL